MIAQNQGTALHNRAFNKGAGILHPLKNVSGPLSYLPYLPYYILFKQRHQFFPDAIPDEGLGGGVRVNAIRLHQILLGTDSVYQ